MYVGIAVVIIAKGMHHNVSAKVLAKPLGKLLNLIDPYIRWVT
jgi:hypothetical protein